VKTVAIMQPTYLPWLGYFSLMDQADTFVFLDSVQFNKRSWQQRNRVKSAQGIGFLTVPVLTKGRRHQKICEVKIDQTQHFPEKHLEAIETDYCKAPFFSDHWKELFEIFMQDHQYLADLNITLVKWLKARLGIDVEFARSSLMNTRGKKVALLIDICKQLGAERYLSPFGSREYIEKNNLFRENGIELCYQDYAHPQYKQLHGSFTPYLSALDLLFNEGETSLGILRTGQKKNITSS